MAASDTEIQWYGQVFKQDVYFLAQQKESRMIMCVDRDDDVLEGGFFDRLGATSMVDIDTRFQPTPHIDDDHSRRYITWAMSVWSRLIDKVDKLKQLADAASAYSRNARSAAGRKIDDVIIAAMTGDAKSGKDGTTLVAFPAGQRILQAFETDKWMSIVKWLEALRLLGSAEVNVEQNDIYITMRQQDIINLLQPTAISTTLANPLLSIDFSTSKGLVDGTVKRYLGTEVIRSERILAGSEASTFGVLVHQKDGIGFTMPQDFEFNLAKDPGFNYNWRPHLKIGLGAVRKEEVKVVCINAKNTKA